MAERKKRVFGRMTRSDVFRVRRRIILELRFVGRRPWEETFNKELPGSAAGLEEGVSVGMGTVVAGTSFSCWARSIEEEKMRAPRASKK